MTTSHLPRPAPLKIDTPSPDVRVISVGGVLDTGTSARLLRLVDSQLMLVRSGQTRLRAVIIDVSTVQALERGAPQGLDHARYACERLGIGFALAKAAAGLVTTPLPVHKRLRGVRVFPTVEAAIEALAGGRVGDPPHDRGAPTGTAPR